MQKKFTEFVKRRLEKAREAMRVAEKAITGFDDSLKLGAFETRKMGEYFNLKAQLHPEKSAELLPLSEAFNRAGLAVMKSLERKGYKLSDADIAAGETVDAWREAFYKNPDPAVALEINSFLLNKMGEFMDEQPKVWSRLAKKDPELEKKVKRALGR